MKSIGADASSFGWMTPPAYKLLAERAAE